jgi:cell division protein FtsI/penicillin-binding protein 2
LYGVVDSPEGTAHEAKIQGLKIYGKTGTAQVAGKSAHGWFVGYVGKDRPKYSFCVLLEHCGSSHLAVGVMQKIIEEMSRRGLFDA